MSNPYIRFYGPDGAAAGRSGATAADAATWTPEDVSPASDAIVDAREFETVRITPVFRDGGGAITTGTNVTVTPLIAVPVADGTAGRVWVALASTGAIADGASADIPVEGHLMGLRVTGVTLGGAASVDIMVTGGKKRETRSHG